MESYKERLLIQEIRNDKYTMGALTRIVIALSMKNERPDFVEFASNILAAIPEDAFEDSALLFNKKYLIYMFSQNIESVIEADPPLIAC